MLVWSNHARNLLESMRAVNMLLTSDMEVICQDGIVKTHSLLLAGASPLLRRALRSLKLELSAGSGVVIVMAWCQKDVVQKALDKLTNAEDFKDECEEMLSVLRELGVNKEVGGTKEEANEIPEPIVTFKLELDASDNNINYDNGYNEAEISDKRLSPNHGDFWESNQTDLGNYEALPPKKKRGRPLKRKADLIEDLIEENLETATALNENINETEGILNEIDLVVFKDDDAESLDLVKIEQSLDNQELFPEHTDHQLEDQIKKMIIRNEEGVFPCQFDNCDYTAGKTSKSRIRQHIMLHLQYRPFRCPHPTCDKTFVERAPAAQHYQVHTGTYSYKCPDCGKQLRSLSAVKQHQLTNHTAGPALFQCQICSYTTNLRGSWKRHELTHKEKEDRPSFSCAECGATYLETRAYQNHVENACPGAGAAPNHGFKATMTPEMREAKEAAIKLINPVSVMEDDKEVKNFVCTQCSYTHKERDHVIRHCYAHTGVRPFHCKQLGCTRQFLEPRSLKDHVVSVHEGVKAYQCDQCDASYSAKASLDSHLKRHLIPPDHFKCDVADCGYATNNPSTLARHKERMHDPDSKKHLCTVCGKPFYDKRQLAKHELNNHTEPTVPCNYCDKFYHSETSRDKHEMTVHSEETPFQCDECPNAYRHPSSLQKHILAIHRGEEARKFRCEECGKGFITNGKLQSHRRVHTGERNYQCPHCEMRFGDQSAMRRHKYTHEGGKRYECNVCGKSYTQHYDVVRHKANVHGIVTTRVKDHANKGKKIKRMPKLPRFSNLMSNEAR